MARYEVAPTKSNMLRLKRDYEFAREGHELLEQKREILIAELFALIDRSSRAQEQVNERLKEAFAALENAVMRMGRHRVARLAGAANIRADLSIRTRRIMGVEMPIISTEFIDKQPYFSPGETSFWADESVRQFKETVKLLGTLAETTVSVLNLTREARKTIRRVNALEKIALPDYKDTLKFIGSSLEELERETFYTMKQVKARLARDSQEKRQRVK